MSLFTQVLRRSLLFTSKKQLTSSLSCLQQSRSYSYEGDGKTTVTILNHEIDSPLMIDSYNERGFTLNNGFAVIGPMAIFPRTVLAWDIASYEDISPESLSLFLQLEPKLDILVLGIGDAGNNIPTEKLKAIRKCGINIEIMRTDNACSTFNFLNVERRCVAAAMIPPRTIRYTDADTVNSRYRMEILYGGKDD